MSPIKARISILVALGLGLTSLLSQAEKPTPVNESSRLACEQKLKTRMKHGEFEFVRPSVAGNLLKPNAQTANQDIKQLLKSTPFFEITQTAGNNTRFSLSYNGSARDQQLSFSVYLNTPPADSSFLYELVLLYQSTKTEPFSKEALTQSFSIGADCVPRLRVVESKHYHLKSNQMTAKGVTAYQIRKADAVQVSQGQAVMPNNSRMLKSAPTDTGENAEEYVQRMMRERSFIPLAVDVPIAEVSAQKLTPSALTIPFTKESVEMEHVEVTYKTLNGSSIFKQDVFLKKNAPYKLARVSQFVTDAWIVPESIWMREALKPTLGPTYQNNSGREAKDIVRLQLTTSAEIDSDLFATYYNNLGQSKLEPNLGWRLSYLLGVRSWPLMESSTPLVTNSNQTSAKVYLQESERVQVSLPAVQELVNSLKPYSTGPGGLPRLNMAQKIAEIVNRTLSYDHEASQQNLVYPLTTSEVLAVRKGVCQHYANLFAAIARGAGIPTRIISGYKADDKGQYVSHAWNEIEIRPGVWRPIEPQSPTLHFHTSLYIPVAVSHIHETSRTTDASLSEMLAYAAFRFKATFER